MLCRVLATRHRTVMKSSLALLILLLLPAHLARAEPGFHYLGFNGRETLMLDLSRLKTIQYPIGSAGNSLGAPTHKTYKEAWVLFIDADLKLAKQVLLVFDCLGRAAELGASVSLQTSTDRSYDLTGYAEGIGVERFMRRIPATSPYVAAQKFVCPSIR